MTRTALRHGPVPPPARTGPHRLDDHVGLLKAINNFDPAFKWSAGISQMHVCRLQAAALSYLRDRLPGPEPAAPPSPPSGSTLTQTRRQA